MGAPTGAYRAAAVALVFVAIAQVYLGGSRGMKIMRHTLYAYWIGQSISWIVSHARSPGPSGASRCRSPSLAYAASWIFATAVAWFFWHKESGRFRPALPAEPGESKASDPVRRSARAGRAAVAGAVLHGPVRALDPAPQGRSRSRACYAACVRVSQALVLFLTAGVLHVQPVRRGPARARRARTG